MLGNLFEDRNWLLPKNYLATENRNENMTSITGRKPSLKEEPKIGEQSIISCKTEKSRWGPDCPFCKNQGKEDWDGKHQNQLQQKTSPQPKVQRPPSKMPPKLTAAWLRNTNSQVSKPDKKMPPMGSRKGETEH